MSQNTDGAATHGSLTMIQINVRPIAKEVNMLITL
jgi:hypothetical protein